MKQNGKMRFIDRQKELENCFFVKTVLMVTVVLYHSILYWGAIGLWGSPYLQRLYSVLLLNG